MFLLYSGLIICEQMRQDLKTMFACIRFVYDHRKYVLDAMFQTCLSKIKQ